MPRRLPVDKLPVTACMLVKNEADRLSRVLPSLALFDEILVFDSGSEDQSIQTCLDAGAKVDEVKWEGFGTTRKKLFSAASSPWIFWIDADEVVTPELADELKALFAGTGPGDRGYEVNRIVRFEDRWIRHGEWFPDWNLRFFRADSWSMEEVAVHERVDLRGRKARIAWKACWNTTLIVRGTTCGQDPNDMLCFGRRKRWLPVGDRSCSRDVSGPLGSFLEPSFYEEDCVTANSGCELHGPMLRKCG